MAKITLEDWGDRDLHIWHWFVGRPATNNDLTLVEASPLINEIILDRFPFSFCTPYTILSNSAERYLP